MQRTLFLDTSQEQNQAVQQLAKRVVAGQPQQNISLAQHLVFSAPREADEDEFLGICESIRDSNILLVGVPPKWQTKSAMASFIKRMAEVTEWDNPFSRKQLILIMPAIEQPVSVIELWSKLAVNFDMDLVGIVTDFNTADQIRQALFPSTKTPLNVVYQLKHH
ncbi:hypothetical protein [Lactiplantibacillus pentosus]|uniref:hypothetical protein n=1 Tax=Lactiplantibacillus pentosus TaxID=1589 RepID=UPI001CD1EE59|nr:hypothetical protein [Lactiplantibacillus pentosus]MCA1344063.1 hypothetical protein [Lactiplantibacillus pentosus]MCJ8185974.1 hypothetical protein [Lactiplantibacillus pentosus]